VQIEFNTWYKNNSWCCAGKLSAEMAGTKEWAFSRRVLALLQCRTKLTQS